LETILPEPPQHSFGLDRESRKSSDLTLKNGERDAVHESDEDGFGEKIPHRSKRKKLAKMQNTPASSASITDIEAYSFGSPAASGATDAATIAQTAASGLMINRRDVPKMA
jgi:hypothetical protein